MSMNPDAREPTLDSDAPRRADALPAGTLIDGCTIDHVVADSGFAIVYAAREVGTDRPMAVKEYLPVSLALRSADGLGVALRAPEHAEAFERGRLAFAAEARLLEQRTHPALLRVLRTWKGHGTLYRVMPWLDGDSLLALRRGLPEPPDEAALKRLLFGLLGALQTLHDAGEVHGAVSPGNIRVLSDDRPVLMDTDAVGRALVGGQTRSLMAWVSPGFAPYPATAAGTGASNDPSGPAADLHALAAVAHFCISGALPAAGERPAPLATLARALRSRSTRPPYSASLLETIDAALSDDIARRPATVAEFRALLSGQGDAARGAAPSEPAAAAAAAEPEPGTAQAAAAGPTRPPVGPAAGPRVRRSGSRRRRSNRLAWWGGGAFAALLIGMVTLVVVNERHAVALRADGALRANGDLEPPSAFPTPQPRAGRAATGNVMLPDLPSTAAPAAADTGQLITARERPTVPAPKLATSTKTTPTEKLAPAPERKRPTASLPLAKPTKPTQSAPPAAAQGATGSPREECGGRTEFALYRCMKTECQQPRWVKHPQCQRLRETDTVD